MATLDVPASILTRSRSLRSPAADSSNLHHHHQQQQQQSTSTPAHLDTASQDTNNNTSTLVNGTASSSSSSDSSSDDSLAGKFNGNAVVNSMSSTKEILTKESTVNGMLLDSKSTLLSSSTKTVTAGTAQRSSSFTATSSAELDAAAILSQSPLFRKKFTSEDAAQASNGKRRLQLKEEITRDGNSSANSLNCRLAALQKNGEEGWRQRVNKETKDVNSNVTAREKSVGAPRERPVSLMARVSQLESSSQTWKVRVSQSDASKFTVAHKLAMSASASSVTSSTFASKTMVPVMPGFNAPPTSGSPTPNLSSSVPNSSSLAVPQSPPSSGGSSGLTTPLGSSPPVHIHLSSSSSGNEGSPPTEAKRVRKTPQPKIFKSKTAGGNIPQMLPQVLPGLRPPRADYRRTISTPAAQGNDDFESASHTVELFEVADEHFNNFFASSSVSGAVNNNTDAGEAPLDLGDLDLVTSNVHTLNVQRRKVTKLARHRATTGNPVKVLAERGLTHYTETRLHAGERELRRNKVQELSKNSSLAMEALAGLASKENFSAVTLRPVTIQDTRELPPYTHPMLLRVKGRRHAQPRLVDPAPGSVNAGDDFILVTPEQVYHYKSDFSNVIERAKASEVAAFIVQQRDLGINSSAPPPIEITENVKGIRRTRFWDVLGGSADSSSASPSLGGDDGDVEASLDRSNKIYRVQGAALVPHEEAWGVAPTVQLLRPDQVLVFDFGSEVYSWSGRRAAAEERRLAVQLARELWTEDYDYTDCDMNPIVPVPLNTVMTGPRPKWGILGKLTENLETVLFKEKFIDWPDTAQQSRIKEVQCEMQRRVDPVHGLQPCSGDSLLTGCPPQPDLLLEMSHLGRGTEYYDAEERRLLVVHTKEYRVWHTTEAGKTLLPSGSRPHFHAGDTYVVRWYYSVTATGRTLKGAPSKHAVTGRERVAYFFWQGRHSSLSDKGASALMTVELDEERGPHVRVTMGSEPPAFLNFFDGAFVVHRGRRNDAGGAPPSGSWRLYLVRGETESEGHLVGVPVTREHLRSRGCVLLTHASSCTIHLWHGAKALRHTRKIASVTAKRLTEGSSADVGWQSSIIPHIKEQFEGAETKDFWNGLEDGEADENQNSDNNTVLSASLAKYSKQSRRFRHLSLLDSSCPYDWSPRIWHFKAKHDSFEATEVTSSYRMPGVPNPMPFVQEDLYAANLQPGLFMVDAGGEIWLWQGWWPACDSTNNNNTEEESSNVYDDAATTGSALLRFNFARKAALLTTIDYANRLGDSCKGEPQLIVAGLEPIEFTNLFPIWTYRQDVASLQKKVGRYTTVTQYPVGEVLAGLCRSHYSLEELQTQPPPDGVDPSRLEHYLAPQDFQRILGMTNDEFAGLQQWKQLDIKKKANLF